MKLSVKLSFVSLAICFALAQSRAQQIIQHVATAANTNNHISFIDHAATNGKPDLVLIVAQNYGVYNANEIGVWYNDGKWKVFNQSRAPIPANAQFNILVLDPAQQATTFIHTTNQANTQGHVTTLDNRYTDGQENVVLFVTQNFGRNNTSPVGVWFSGGKWKIYNETRQPLPMGTKFNVLALKEGNLPQGWKNISGSVFRHKVAESNKNKFATKHVSYIDNAATNNKKTAYLFATQHYKNTYNTSVAGVWYDQPNWTVFNEDRKAIPENTWFNILSIEPAGRIMINPRIIKSTAVVIKQNETVPKNNWKVATKINANNLTILPYKFKPTETTAQPDASSTEIQGPNVTLGKDVSVLLGAEFSYFANKLNLFRDLYEDKNTKSGYFYYLPKNYNLKWNRETGEYSFYIYYLSADADGRGEVIITAELTPNINRDDVTFAEALLSKKLNKEVKLRPLPLKDTPKMLFGSSLTNFDVKDESVNTNVPTDFLEPIVVSWKMEKRVDDLIGAMMNNIGIMGNMQFLPLDESDKTISVPVKLKINDPQTFGKLEYTEASGFLNGFYNPIDYPVQLKEVVVLRKKVNNEYSLQNIPLASYEVEPLKVFSSFTSNERNAVVNGDAISKLWVEYSIKPCTTCNTSVQSKIMGGTSNSRVKSIEVQVLGPLQYSGANTLKLLIKSKQGDPNGKSDVLLPIVNITQDNQTISGGDLFIPESGQPDYQYQLVLIQPDGNTVMSDWIQSNDLFVIIGENTIKENFKTEESASADQPQTDEN